MFKPDIAATAVAMISPAEGGPAVSDIDVIDQQRLNTAAEKSKFENRDAGLSSLRSRAAAATLTMARKICGAGGAKVASASRENDRYGPLRSVLHGNGIGRAGP